MRNDMKALALFAALATIAGPTVAQEVTIKIADSLPADHIITGQPAVQGAFLHWRQRCASFCAIWKEYPIFTSLKFP